MPYIARDSAAANEQRTAVRITKPAVSSADRTLSFQPAYTAVQGDAGTVASMLLLKQRKAMQARYLGIALLIMVAGAVLILIYFGPVWDGLIPIAVIAAVMPLYFVSGSIRAEGIRINETVYRNLTPEDRDALFLARDKYLADAVLRLLTERYTAAEEQQRNEEEQRSSEEEQHRLARARRLLARSDTPTQKEEPDSHDRHL